MWTQQLLSVQPPGLRPLSIVSTANDNCFPGQPMYCVVMAALQQFFPVHSHYPSDHWLFRVCLQVEEGRKTRQSAWWAQCPQHRHSPSFASDLHPKFGGSPAATTCCASIGPEWTSRSNTSPSCPQRSASARSKAFRKPRIGARWCLRAKGCIEWGAYQTRKPHKTWKPWKPYKTRKPCSW